MKFQNKVDDADCRLGAIFCRVFDDASDLEHAFKVSDAVSVKIEFCSKSLFWCGAALIFQIITKILIAVQRHI